MKLYMKKIIIALISVALVSMLSIPAYAAVNFAEDFSDPSKLTYYVYENDGFKVQDGAFVAKSSDKYNAAYYGQYFESCVYEFDIKDFGGGEHIGGASLRVGSARYDVEVRSDAKNDDEKILIYKGGPNKKASNTMKATGKGIPSIPEGQWVNVKIALTKDTIKVYVNDILYVDYKDSLPYTTGGFGFRSANSNIGYDNIKIYDLPDLVLNPKPTTATTTGNNTTVSNTTVGNTTVKVGNTTQPNASSNSTTQPNASSDSSMITNANSGSITSVADQSGSNSSSSLTSDNQQTINDKKGSAVPIIITIAVIVLLGGLGAALYFFKFKKKA